MAEASTIEVPAEAETPTTRSQMEKHEGFVSWYADELGGDLSELTPAEIIAEFARLRNEFRRSEFYLKQWGPEAREASRKAREEAREKAAEAREAARKEKAAAKAKAKAEAEAAGEGEEGETKPKARTRKRVAKKAAPSTIEVDETGGGEDSDEDEIFD
jgi:ElaB/YqjD/DUF883 family membrane-anchored ribosome-binding protein